MTHRITASDLASAQHVLQHAMERETSARRKRASAPGDAGELRFRGREGAYPREEDLGFGVPPSLGAGASAAAEA